MFEVLFGLIVLAVLLLAWPPINRWHARRAWRLAEMETERRRWRRWMEDVQ